MKRKILLFILICTSYISANSQISNRETDIKQELATRYIAKLGVGYDRPGGDLADRFGSNLNFHLGLERLSVSNWYISGEFTYRFGGDVREDVLAPIRLETFNFLAIDGLPSDAFLRMRGASLSLSMGKVIGIDKKRPKSGIKIGIGATYLSHYIRVLDENQALTQVMAGYERGYDRLTRGFGINQYIGYQYMSLDGNLNFNVGLEFNQVFSSAVRSVDFDTNQKGQSGRKDLLSGIKITWLIPIWTDTESSKIYY